MRVTVKDLTSGEERQLHSKYLIAADGGHSRVRELLGIGYEGRGFFSNSLTIYFHADLSPWIKDNAWSIIYVNNPALGGFFRHPSDALRIVALGFPFYAWGMVISQSFNGAGDTRTPTLLNFFVFWCWEIPLAYVLAIKLGLGPRGIYVAMTIAFSTLAVAGFLVFRRGTWKTKRL